ncbi:MAG: hypothetical protein IVW54_03875 [Candidatus Binataceae bacterium]|nr:hypothetical protein [Candidatus Binataceae bacterium]
MNRASYTMRLLAAAIAIALGCGCGVKGAPIPPETTRPMQILDLEAIPEHRGIQLSWTRPQQYFGGKRMRDLGGFVVMRAEGQEQYAPVVEIPVTDQERFQVVNRFSYTDHTVSGGHTYRYEVYSHTTDGYRSLPSNEVVVHYVRSSAAPHPKTPASPATERPPSIKPAPPPPSTP